MRIRSLLLVLISGLNYECSTRPNKDLSSLPKNRALIIKNYLLLKHGIESSRLMTLNCDARAPIAPNNTEEGRAFNRRVYGLLTEPDSDYPINLKDGICIEF